uniref:Uncharacterized protein n=1 Tax=Rhizophora mucronata TaxID=61149 RepID=A0A2P2JQ88_RHIMU
MLPESSIILLQIDFQTLLPSQLALRTRLFLKYCDSHDLFLL